MDDTRVEQATLTVDVLVVDREFVLSFVPVSVSVQAGATVDVMLELSNAGLLADDGSEVVVVTLMATTVTVTESVTLTVDTTRVTLTIDAALADVGSLPEAVTATGVVMLGGSPVVDTTVEGASLAVEILPVVRVFVLSFVPVSASVVAGGTVDVLLELSNAGLLADDGSEVVVVMLDATTVTVTAPVGPVTLTQDTSSVTLTIDAELADVGLLPEAVTATGVVMLGGSPVDDTTVEGASLAVEILPVVRVFGLQFEVAGTVVTMVGVLAGGMTEVGIGLLNADSLELDEEVVVTLTPQTVTVDSSSVTLTAEMPSTTLTIDAALADVGLLPEAVTATGVVMLGGSPVDDTTVEGAAVSGGDSAGGSRV